MRFVSKTRTTSPVLKAGRSSFKPRIFEIDGQRRAFWSDGGVPYQGKITWEAGPRAPSVTLTDRIDGWVGKKTEFHQVTHVRNQLAMRGEPNWCYGPRPMASLAPEQQAARAAGVPGLSWEGNGILYERSWNSFGGVMPTDPSTSSLPLDWRKAYESILDDIAGLLPAQKSIAVNVAEFSQLRRLVPSIAKPISNLLRWMRREPNRVLDVKYKHRTRRGRWITRRKRVKVSSGRWTLRDLAQLNLANQFGVQPLAEDLGDFASKYFEAKLHLDWYRQFANGERKTARAVVTAFDSSEDDVRDASWYNNRQKLSTEVTGILGAHVRINPVSGSVLADRLLAQILGINVPLQIAWELVPFSFVIDWFLPVGETLSRFEPKRYFGSLAAKVTFLQTWHTVKTVASSSRTLTPKNQRVLGRFGRTGQSYLLGEFYAEKRRTAYARIGGWPKFNVFPPRKGRFTLNSVGLTLSLLVQKLFK